LLLRLCVMAAALLGLASCDQVADRVSEGLSRIGGVAAEDATSEGIRTLALLDGSVRARGPDGYCIDQLASDAQTGFVVMAGCALLSEEAAIMPTPDALITIQFGDEGSASITDNEDAFAGFLESEAGRALLAQDGEASSVEAVSTISDRAGVLARFEDSSGPTFSGTTGSQWRGFLDVGGRLTTVSVLSFDRNVLSLAEGERLLVIAMAELAEVNAPEASDTLGEET